MSNPIGRQLPVQYIQMPQQHPNALNMGVCPVCPPSQRLHMLRIEQCYRSAQFPTYLDGIPLTIIPREQGVCECQRATQAFIEQMRGTMQEKDEVIKKQKGSIDDLRERIKDFEDLIDDFDGVDSEMIENEQCIEKQKEEIKKKRKKILKLDQKIEEKEEILSKRNRKEGDDLDLPPKKRRKLNSTEPQSYDN